MSDKNRMPEVDLKKLNAIDLEFVKLVERQNKDRVEKLLRTRKNNLITASVLGAGVLGIYFYSMYAVKQERFLDDFLVPEKVIEESK